MDGGMEEVVECQPHKHGLQVQIPVLPKIREREKERKWHPLLKMSK
jgi:hypothetical protein